MSKKDQSPENENDSQTLSPIGEIEHGPSGFEAFLDAHQKKLIIVGGILIVAAIAYVIGTGLKRKEIEAAAAEVSAASDITELRAVYEKFSDTPAGATALVKIADEYWADQEQQKAISTLKDAASQYPDHPNIGSIRARLANYHRALGEKDEAKAQFEAAVESDSAVSSYALQQLAAIATENGDNEAAAAYLNQIINDYGKRHLNFKPITQELQKLIGVTPATEVAPAEEKPKESASAPATLPDLPELPDLPDLPKTPQPVLPSE